MAFKVEITNVTRDFYQGKLGNRPALSNEKNTEANTLWNGLVVDTKTNSNSNSQFNFGIIETGGAEPQVQEVFANNDYTEDLRALREAAPDTGQRPLLRGENAHGLAPNSPLEIKAITKENIRNSGGMPRQKVFDSQADMRKLHATVEAVVESHAEGYPAELEIVIPYGNGEADQKERALEYQNFNPYPDEFYVKRVREAIQVAKESGLSDEHLIISFKCMVGDMDEETSERLTRKIMQELEAQGSKARFALHLHDTGLSKRAYVAAIKVAKEFDRGIIVDTAEGPDTGFVSALELDEELKAEGIDLGLTEDQKKSLRRMSEISNEVAAEYNVRKISDALTGEDARRYGIPGGGMAAFETAVLGSGLAAQLNISEADALHVAGKGLVAAKQITGFPFGVTPGFMQTQTASLHLIKNMINDGYLTSDMSVDEIKDKIVQKFDDQQVEKFFLNKMPASLGNFIRNNRMPTEYGNIEHGVHPKVREAYPLNEELKEPSNARFFQIQAEVQKLQSEGLAKPTVRHADLVLDRMVSHGGFNISDDDKEIIKQRLLDGNAIYEKPDGQKSDWHKDIAQTLNNLKAEGIIKASNGNDPVEYLYRGLKDAAENSAICRQIVLGEGNPLRDRLEKPWIGEPLATQFQNNAPEYNRGVALYQKGLSAQLDRDPAEILRQHLWAGNVDINEAYCLAGKMIQHEWEEIRSSVLTYMEENPAMVMSAVEGQSLNRKSAVNQAIAQIKDQQKDIIEAEKSGKGRLFYYSDQQRETVALGFFKQQIEEMAKAIPQSQLKSIIEDAAKPPEIKELKAGMAGVVVDIPVSKGDVVEKGAKIIETEAMKMMHPVIAGKQQIIKSVNCKLGDLVEQGQVLIEYEVPEPEPNAIDIHVAGLREANTTALENLKHQIDQQEPSTIIGYSLDVTKKPRLPQPDSKYVDLVINRAGCAAKISDDLNKAGFNPMVLYTRQDKDTPVIREADKDQAIQVRSYTDHDEILRTIKDVGDKNPSKTVLVHPGWGFLSENHAFVAKLENAVAKQNMNAVFVGPSSNAMELAGGKYSLRNVVHDVAPQYNPDYFENPGTIEELRDYVTGGFQAEHKLAAPYRRSFEEVNDNKMRGNVIIKAVAGGGGKGMERFQYDDDKNKEANYRDYIKLILKNREYSKAQYGNYADMTERFVTGNAHHVEVQFAATKGNAMMLGYRDCTLQLGGQKIAETNIIKGDYTPAMIAKIREAGEKITSKLAEKGYEGVGTLEMLAIPETEEVMILEVNTRLQVEHGVTEGDIKLKTDKDVSLPVLNRYLRTNDAGKTPQKIVEDVFGLNERDQEKLLVPGKERYMEIRINAKQIDLFGGDKKKVAPFKDTDWPAHLFDKMESKYGVKIIHGGKGTGPYDAQVGAILGTRKQIDQALPEMIRFFELSALFERSERGTNLNNAQYLIDNLLFTENGKINSEISVNTVDDLLDKIAEDQDYTLASKADLVDEPHWPNDEIVHEL